MPIPGVAWETAGFYNRMQGTARDGRPCPAVCEVGAMERLGPQARREAVSISHRERAGKVRTVLPTTLGLSFLLPLAPLEIGQGAFSRWRAGTSPHVTLTSFAVMIITMGVNVFVSWYETRVGQRLPSEILVADALHTRSDLSASVAVGASLIA